MSGRNYQRLDVVTFGRQLFESCDLDPIYVALLSTYLERDQLSRWLVAYWYFYNAGFSSYASEREGKDFWATMRRAARNTFTTPYGGRWPRGTERRHLRGAIAVNAMYGLARAYPRPEAVIEYLLEGPMDVKAVIERAKTLPACGPWIGFKIADMIDGVLKVPVKQDDLTPFLYKTPRESIEISLKDGTIPRPRRRDPFEFAMEWLQIILEDCHIPHKPRNAPDWFSLETVFCKHLSHMHGHYHLYKDTQEINEGLEPWRKFSNTARRFQKYMPELPPHVELV